jgi:hypothetical protein
MYALGATLLGQPIPVGDSQHMVSSVTSGYPCSSPGCDKAAAWAVLSETERVGDRSEWAFGTTRARLLVTSPHCGF